MGRSGSFTAPVEAADRSGAIVLIGLSCLFLLMGCNEFDVVLIVLYCNLIITIIDWTIVQKSLLFMNVYVIFFFELLCLTVRFIVSNAH